MEGVIKDQKQSILAHDGRYHQLVEAHKQDQQQVLEAIRKMCEGNEEIRKDVSNIKLMIRPAVTVSAPVITTSRTQKPPPAASVDPPATQVSAPAITTPHIQANPLPPGGHGDPPHHNKGSGTLIPLFCP